MNEPIPAGAVVVGIDGSDHSHRALDAASAVAAREHRPLHLLHCYEPYPAAMGPVVPSPDVTTTLRGIAESVVKHGRERVTSTNPSVPVTTSLSTHDAREKLSAVSHSASVVVVGSRGRGAMRSLLMGSVSVWVANHSACPVLVVRPEPEPEDRTGAGDGGADDQPDQVDHGVVVGADETSRSQAAIEYAFLQASLRRLPLRVVHCVAPMPYHEEYVPLDEERDELPLHRLELSEAVAGLREKFPDVQVELVLARGPAPAHLVEESRRARLLVLGAHHRSVWDLFLGSVNRSVVEHALCPVAVVPGTRA